ncbi:LexA family transcriptional regulator [Sphingomonas sp. C8-2]|jgi:SOS-response transcriptional repressor LexA|nr:LexA family transcriptional regulator [Sphingomonas sp. C8-2]QEH81164.1 LexA family transcriptional regulator [Sphingomonas sp. C8-2]
MTPDEIRAAMAARGLTVRQLAGLAKMNENHLTKSLGAAGRRFTVSEMDRIRAVLIDDDDPNAEPPQIRTIPLLGEVPAGALAPALQRAGRRLAVSDPETPPRAYALTVRGDSMDLIVPDGSTLVIDPDDLKLWPGRRYVVQTEDGQTTFKEFQADPARLVPCSSNPEHKEIMLGSEPVKVLGRVFSYSMRDVPRRAV